MKGQLIFDLPEEQEEFETHLKAQSYRNVLIELQSFIEGRVMHPSAHSDSIIAYQLVHNMLDELLSNHRVNL